ncbi:enhancer of polycomb-like-domain-containing protein [Umbelopsis sp. AD052]|nr:enhancer of polycomb-like-domain-containing protein [Umbelopsis sp. AD052]
MSSRFRVKRLKFDQSLAIHRQSDLPDLEDQLNGQRSAPQVETGVDKEEEEEHHLQAAISASHAAYTTGGQDSRLYIPTPDASQTIDLKEFHRLYKTPFNNPSSFVRFSATVEDSIGCPYMMDEVDDEWLMTFNKSHPKLVLSEDTFESILWRIESVSLEKVPYLQTDITNIPPYSEFEPEFSVKPYTTFKEQAKHVYEHWKKRRIIRKGVPLIPSVKMDEALRDDSDPYVCFRRRETKAVRKTRRTDQQSMEKLRKLRAELETARSLLEMVTRREKLRKESLLMEHSIFNQRCMLREMQQQLDIKDEQDLFPIKKKRKTEAYSSTRIKIPINKLKRDVYDADKKSAAQAAIDAEVARRRERNLGFEDVTDSGYQPFLPSIPSQFFRNVEKPSETTPRRQPTYRKRIGRGGRVFIDRRGFRPAETGGKYKPSLPMESDASDDEDYMVDDMDDRYLSYSCSLLQENELRNLITIPSLNPNTITAQQVGIILPAQALKTQVPNDPTRSSQQAIPIKRQSSKQRLTPQQAALAMTNDMIAANVAAAVGTPHRDKASMQLALQHLQQQHGTTDVGTLQKKILTAQLAQHQRLKDDPNGPQKENGNRRMTIQMPPNLLQTKAQVLLSPSSNPPTQSGSTDAIELRQQHLLKKPTTLPNTPVDSPPHQHSQPSLTHQV